MSKGVLRAGAVPSPHSGSKHARGPGRCLGCPSRAGSFAVVLLAMMLMPFAGIRAQPMTTSSARGTLAFVDFEHVFTNYYKTRLANDQLFSMSDAINRERAAMMADYDRNQQEYAELRAKLAAPETPQEEADAIRDDLDEILLAMKRQDEAIKQYNKAQETRWLEQNRRIRGALVEDIQKKLHGYMKAKGYLAVIDRSQVNDKNVPAVLYVDDGADVTGEFLEELNK